MVNVWVVGHPYNRRRWCEVRVRDQGQESRQPGFVWAEWNAPVPDDPFVARLPSLSSAPMSNVDPLVFGPRMYFDYCRKGRSSSARSLARPNSLNAGDLVVFACAYKKAIWIDTVFAIGATRQWPRASGSLPNWDSIGAIAERVHFHQHAVQQHPEVRDAHRSYRSASDRDPDCRRYAWVPWSKTTTTPFELHAGSPAFGTLQAIYAGKNIFDGFTGLFAVVPTSETTVQQLFEQLLALAQSQGFGIAAEIDFVDDEEVTYGDSDPDGCGAQISDDEVVGCLLPSGPDDGHRGRLIAGHQRREAASHRP